MSDPVPSVHLLTTGGTIQNDLDVGGYLPGEVLLDDVPEAREAADVSVEDVASVGSHQVTPEVWWALAERISAAADTEEPPDGFVVTSGSNSLEETAYFLNLVIDTDLPVALTASQRNHGMVGNDGDRNLVDAIRVAGHPDAAGRGAMVVLNDQIHHAREVTKTVTSRPDAWSSGDLGILGLCDKYGYVEFYRETRRRHAPGTDFDIAGTTPDDLPMVAVEYSTAGEDGHAVEAHLDAGAEGIVYAGFPTGAPAEPDGAGQAKALSEAAEKVPVVMSHRGADGWPYRRRTRLEGGPFVWGDTLSPQKAKILLALGLMRTGDPDELQAFFLRY